MKDPCRQAASVFSTSAPLNLYGSGWQHAWRIRSSFVVWRSEIDLGPCRDIFVLNARCSLLVVQMSKIVVDT